jgi:superfamily II DNA or RNA helicase
MTNEILKKLRPWQIEPAKHLHSLLLRGQNVVDCSDCGVGKTYVACAVMSALKLPTLVVVPKIAQTQWESAAAHFNDTVSVIGYEKLRTGRTPFGTWDNLPIGDEDRDYFVCQCCQLRVDFENYQPCHCHPCGWHCIIERKVAWKYGKFNFHPAVKMVIFDELQRCGGLDSLNADMLLAARRQNLRVLGLSATLATSPLQLKALGYVLGLYPSPREFVPWVRRYGVRYDANFRGLHWFAGEDKQQAIMREIRESLIPARGVRVSTAEIPEFPAVDIQAELYDIDPEARVKMAEALEALAKHSGQHLPNSLTEQLSAQQQVELVKVPLAVELAQDYLAKGYSVGLFVNYRRTMDELRARLKCNYVIDGSDDGVRYRGAAIEAFQTHQSRLILINAQAGGAALSLPDLDGNHPRAGLVFPGYSAEKLRQVFGRFPRENGKSKSLYRVLLAAKTGDVKIHKALRGKLNNLDALNDADLMPENLTIAGR